MNFVNSVEISREARIWNSWQRKQYKLDEEEAEKS